MNREIPGIVVVEKKTNNDLTQSLAYILVPTMGQEILLQNITIVAMSMAQSSSKAGSPAMTTVTNPRLSMRTSLA